MAGQKQTKPQQMLKKDDALKNKRENKIMGNPGLLKCLAVITKKWHLVTREQYPAG